MSDKSKCDCVFWSKPAMSNASFHNFDSRLNGLRCDFATNKLKLEHSGKDSPPRILCVFIQPSANFRQSFVSSGLKNQNFPCYGKIFLPMCIGPPRVPRQAFVIWAITLWSNNYYSLEQFSMTVKSNCYAW